MKRKQFISIFLCVILLIGLLPLTASATDYELTVDGVPVTEGNAADILGNGVFSYVPEQNTLYIHGSYEGTSDPLIENRIDGLKLYADHPVDQPEQPSELTAPGTAIRSFADLTLAGYPGLTLRCGETSGCVEIREGKRLTLSNLVLTVRGGAHALSGCETSEELAISFCLLDLESEQDAVWGFGGAITLEGSSFTEPAATSVSDDGIISWPTDENGEIVGPSYRPSRLYVYTYADSNQNGQVNVDDTVRLMGLIYFCKYYDTHSPELDFDGDGENDPEDAAVLLQSLFPDGALKRIVVVSYDPDTWRFLGSFVINDPADFGDAELDFCAKASYLSFFCLGEGLSPLCKKAGARIPELLKILFS